MVGRCGLSSEQAKALGRKTIELGPGVSLEGISERDILVIREKTEKSTRKIPELVEDIPELAHKPPNAEPILSTVQEMFQQLPDKGRDTILDLIGSELILEIPEQMYEYPLRRETLRVLLELVYS